MATIYLDVWGTDFTEDDYDNALRESNVLKTLNSYLECYPTIIKSDVETIIDKSFSFITNYFLENQIEVRKSIDYGDDEEQAIFDALCEALETIINRKFFEYFLLVIEEEDFNEYDLNELDEMKKICENDKYIVFIDEMELNRLCWNPLDN